MIFPDFDPIIFQIGPVAIRWYALAYVAGIALGWWYAMRLSRNEALWGKRFPVATKDQVEDLVLWVTFGIIVGGRLGYMIFYDTAAIWERPFEIIKIWKGGMSFHGGLIGVILAYLLVAKLHKIDLLKIADLAAPAIPIGLFFGRLANFVNAELWGRETYAPWGVVFCNDTIRENSGGICPAGEGMRHPSQLYEAGLEGIVLLAVLWVAVYQFGILKRRGAAAGLFLAGYGLFRMLIETVREPDQNLAGWPFGLTMGMVLSLPMLLGGIYLLIRSRGPKGEAEAERRPLTEAPKGQAEAVALAGDEGGLAMAVETPAKKPAAKAGKAKPKSKLVE